MAKSAADLAREASGKLKQRLQPIASQAGSFLQQNPTPASFIQKRVVPRIQEVYRQVAPVGRQIVQQVKNTPTTITPVGRQPIVQDYNPVRQAITQAFPITQVPTMTKQYLYDPETKRAFPQSPYYDVVAAKTPQELARVSVSVAGGLIGGLGNIKTKPNPQKAMSE